MPFSKASLIYRGAVRTPHESTTDVTPLPSAYPEWGRAQDGPNFGGKPFAIDLPRREFLLGTRYGRIIRLQMVPPKLHTNDDVNTFPIANYAAGGVAVGLSGPSSKPNPPTTDQSWFEVSDPWDIANAGQGGFIPLGPDKILVSGTTYYDANNGQRRSHFIADWPSHSPASGYYPNRSEWKPVGEPGQQGMTSGYMTRIPTAWQERLKGNMLTGNAMLPIISRGSAGPCAFAFKTEDMFALDAVPATMLVGYPNGHWMPEHPWNNPEADDIYNMATVITGMTILGDTLVFVGAHGYGKPCYGNGTGNPDLHGQPSGDGSHWCYDPTSGSKGNHAYPYRPQVWFYPLSQLAEVAAGIKAPWDLRPEWFALDLPFVLPNGQLNGCAYDAEAKLFYVSAYAADGYGYEPGPVLYAYEFDGDAEPPIEPPAPTNITTGSRASESKVNVPTIKAEDVVPPPTDPCADLQRQVAALTLALNAETQRHNETKAVLGKSQTNLSSINSEATTILNRNAALKPKDKLPGWCTDSVRRIQDLSKTT